MKTWLPKEGVAEITRRTEETEEVQEEFRKDFEKSHGIYLHSTFVRQITMVALNL